MACVSHLPHVLANVLVAQARGRARAARATSACPPTGPSFRDATRVAGANTAIWTDIYLSNRDALIAAIDEAIAAWGGACAARGATRRVRLERARARAREALLGAGLAGGRRTSCASRCPTARA